MSNQSSPIRFVHANEEQKNFVQTLHQRVNEYFKKTGKTRRADGHMVFKTVFFITGTVLLYSLVVFGGLTPLQLIPVVMLLGAFKAFVAFNVGHDAIHGSYSSKKWVNKLLGRTFDLLGGSSYMWSITHNQVHHTYTNIPEHDEDIEMAPNIIRLSPKGKWYWHMQFQKYYAFLLYGLAAVFRVFRQDYVKFFQKEIGAFDNRNHPKVEYFNLFFYKGLYYAIFIIIPFLIMDLPWWQFAIGFLTMMLAEGFVLGLVFQLAHVVEGVDYPEPVMPEGMIENSWAIHQLFTTADFARKSWLADFVCGGLNFQVEHHLFPNICHTHYAKLSEIVKETAEEFELPYLENKTFWSALRSHYRMLDYFGQKDLSAVPSPLGGVAEATVKPEVERMAG